MSPFTALQFVIPKRIISRIVGKVARARILWFKNVLIRSFIAHYHVDLTEAQRQRVEEYVSFEDFFTREFTPGTRPKAIERNAILSPADGIVSASGYIQDQKFTTTKGHYYELHELLAERPVELNTGSFLTIYLAPKNYHRVHAPFNAILRKTTEIPGSLFSVNDDTEANIRGLFKRNERLVCWFETDQGTAAMILVGAMIVASIDTTWPGPISPYRQLLQRTPDQLKFERGDEVARFTMGSTVILLLPEKIGKLWKIQPGTSIQVRSQIGELTRACLH